MHGILDYISKSMRAKFRPSCPDELFALALARRLGEPQTAAHYALLLSQYPQSHLIAAYRAVKGRTEPGENLGAIFHFELPHVPIDGHWPRLPVLAAIRIERRTLAAAVFSGTRLKGVRVRHLPAGAAKSEASAASFVSSILADFGPSDVIVERSSATEGRRVAGLQRTVRALIADSSLPFVDAEVGELLVAFGHPPLPNRRDLRAVAGTICPLPNLKPNQAAGLDAVALGLYAQTERLFTT